MMTRTMMVVLMIWKKKLKVLILKVTRQDIMILKIINSKLNNDNIS